MFTHAIVAIVQTVDYRIFDPRMIRFEHKVREITKVSKVRYPERLIALEERANIYFGVLRELDEKNFDCG